MSSPDPLEGDRERCPLCGSEVTAPQLSSSQPGAAETTLAHADIVSTPVNPTPVPGAYAQTDGGLGQQESGSIVAKKKSKKALWLVILGVAVSGIVVLVILLLPAIRFRTQIVGQWRGEACVAVFKRNGTVWIEEISPGFSKGESGDIRIGVSKDGRTIKFEQVNRSGFTNGACADYTIGFTTADFCRGDSFQGGMWGTAKFIDSRKIHLQALIENKWPDGSVSASRIDAILTREGDVVEGGD